MCGIYDQRYDYMPYQVHLSVCPFICTYIELPCMYNLGGDEVKAYFIIVQQNTALVFANQSASTMTAIYARTKKF